MSLIRPGLCIGLDFEASLEEYIIYIEETVADVYKVNPAFIRSGISDLAQYLNKNKIPWIYDAKLGDVPHTNIKYAEYVFDQLGASGVTLNPFVGLEALSAFFKYKDKICFILCCTSNSNSEVFQQYTEEAILNYVKCKPNLGIVYAGNKDITRVSKRLVGNLILAPGIGVQGGDVGSHSGNVLFSASRSIRESSDSRMAVKLLRAKIDKLYLLKQIQDYILEGDFVLSSGGKSNFYVDLKGLSRDIYLFDFIVNLLAERIESPAVLGIEAGSISYATGIALKNKLGFGFIRKTPKKYATKNYVEGLSPTRVTIIEDVVSTGNSLDKAIQLAEVSGFIIEQVIVLVNRNPNYKCKYRMQSLVNLF